MMRGFVIFLALLLLSGCASEPGQARVALILRPGDAEYWQQVEKGAAEAAREFDVALSVYPAGGLTQAEQLSACVREGFGAVVIAPDDVAVLETSCGEAAKSGTPLVAVDSALRPEYMVSLVSSNNIQATNMLGRRIVEWSGGSGRMLVVSFSDASLTARERNNALGAFITANSGITIADTVYGDSDEETAYMETLQALAKDPEINIIVGLDSVCVLGAARAVQQLGRGTMLFGFDCSQAQALLLEEDVLLATAVQSPYAMGYLGVKNACAALRGEEVPKSFSSPVIIITKSNMFTIINQKMVFPFG